MSQFDFSSMLQYLPDILSGAIVTLELAALSLALGVVIGLLLGLARISGVAALSWPAYAYIEFFRTTPPLVQIIWVYFCLPLLTGLDLNSFKSAMLALGFNIGAFLAEIFRAGIQNIEPTQWHAARVLGLTRYQTLRYVILPQAARNVVAPVGTTVILLVKGTALASAVGVPELLRIGKIISEETFRPMEALTVVAIAYFVITYPMALGFYALERRLRAGEA
jgi:His/Glu/Gln/Arg/opine family amino acid ABC transporter permease subunit